MLFQKRKKKGIFKLQWGHSLVGSIGGVRQNYRPTEQSYLKNEMAVSSETVLDESETDETSCDPKTLATVILLSIEPLVSSVINGSLAYNSGGALKRKVKHLRKRKRRLKISHTLHIQISNRKSKSIEFS